MIYGIGLILLPIVLFLASFPLWRKLPTTLKKFYGWTCAVALIGGGFTTIYIASYSGEQGGITAFFFQLGVIFIYLALTAGVLLAVLFRRLSKPPDA